MPKAWQPVCGAVGGAGGGRSLRHGLGGDAGTLASRAPWLPVPAGRAFATTSASRGAEPAGPPSLWARAAPSQGGLRFSVTVIETALRARERARPGIPCWPPRRTLLPPLVPKTLAQPPEPLGKGPGGCPPPPGHFVSQVPWGMGWGTEMSGVDRPAARLSLPGLGAVRSWEVAWGWVYRGTGPPAPHHTVLSSCTTSPLATVVPCR